VKSPYTDKEMILKIDYVDVEFRGEKYNVNEFYYYCEDSNKKLMNTELATRNENQLYNAYRSKHSIPFPQDLEIFRNYLELSTDKISKLFGFGINQWKQYEDGKMPNNSNSKILKSINNKEFVLNLISDYEITSEKKENLKVKYNEFYKNMIYEKNLNSNYIVNEQDNYRLFGYRRLSLLKTINIFNYISTHIQKGKTAFNKILFFIEFSYFKRYSSSITGLSFRAMERGPVPPRYDILFNIASINGFVTESEHWYDSINDFVPYYSKGNENFNKSLFSKSEVEIIESIVNNLKNKTKEQLEELSHKEQGWIDNRGSSEFIDFSYAYKLN